MKMDKELLQNCIGKNIDKFTTEFIIFKKENDIKILTYSEEFEDSDSFCESANEFVNDGYEKIFFGQEIDIECIRRIEEDKEDFNKMFNYYYKHVNDCLN